MATVFIGIGGNIENPLEHVKSAIETLQNSNDISDFKVSSLYTSKPYGVTDQPYFINAVAKFDTSLPPIPLLNLLQSIEQEHKRVRLTHWGPRTLDLDILYYDKLILNNERLIIPHREILKRAFVVIPLLEIEPNFTDPNGVILKNIIKDLPKDDIQELKILKT
jgi:2-amino-4-hydroxy-6-hydroxymethyldihydropteridine diphosphokinase